MTGAACATRIVLSGLAARRDAAQIPAAQIAEDPLDGPLRVDRGWCTLLVEERSPDGRIRRTRGAVNLALATRVRDGAGEGTLEVQIGGEWIFAICRRADLLEACRRARELEDRSASGLVARCSGSREGVE